MTLRKNYQKKFNKIVHEMNRNVEKDNLWMGRFVARQRNANMEMFSDGSGGIFHITMTIIDKKTGYYKDYLVDYAPFLSGSEYNIWICMNKFITEDVAVWYEDPSPREKEFIHDYRNVKVANNFCEIHETNYFLNKEALFG